MRLDFEKGGGLVPAIIQDAASKSILMLGYMNEAALAKTEESGWVTFYSRTRQRLWTKGESSGHRLKVLSWVEDCDRDTLLFQVEAMGPTCHTGANSCFSGDRSDSLPFLRELETVLRDRSDTGSSYTARLMREGPKRIAQKIGEEGLEAALALATNDKAEFIEESADLLYHLLVGLAVQGLSVTAVTDCLKARHHAARVKELGPQLE